ncbi:hypothetical protein B0H15DRAFT_942346 [Mycena belliarum]|uniref:NACHT domain-containing protein n=1 Tax=Mycena belliarum TaxID=1033014 RepID=A0AAD6XYE9_9AGAR|nr:hypothetical protein B0H15DRAFT_942346 [Mycena belliae]
MPIELGASPECGRVSSLLRKLEDLAGALICLLRGLWTHTLRSYVSCLFQPPRAFVNCEKEPPRKVDAHETYMRIVAALKRRTAADSEFETQVMALLDPVQSRLTELAKEVPLARPPRGPEPLADLPPAPQIFCGRERELTGLVHMFSQGRQAHVALLGSAGTGKSALALALLHHPKVARVFGARHFFVPCETPAGAFLHLASAFGLPHTPSRDAVLSVLAASSHSLVVLDGLDSPPAFDDLLALAALPRVSLILTLRGGRRPAGPLYTTPLPAPLGPLAPSAARAVFRAISDLPIEGDADAGVFDALISRLHEHA